MVYCPCFNNIAELMAELTPKQGQVINHSFTLCWVRGTPKTCRTTAVEVWSGSHKEQLKYT